MAKTSKELKDAVLEDLYVRVCEGEQDAEGNTRPAPASLIAQAVNFLKVFPPDQEKVGEAQNRSELLEKYSGKVTKINDKR